MLDITIDETYRIPNTKKGKKYAEILKHSLIAKNTYCNTKISDDNTEILVSASRKQNTAVFN